MTDKIKFLWSSTLSRGIPSGILDFSKFGNHMPVSWGGALWRHAKDSLVYKTIGLQNLSAGAFECISKFDIMFFYLVPIANIGYSWETMPAMVKERCNPCPKLIMQIDNDMAQMPPCDSIKKSMNSSDLIISVSRNCLDEFPKYTQTPVEYLQTPRYCSSSVYPPLEPKRIEERKGIGYLRHTYVPPRNGMNRTIDGLEHAISIAKKTNKLFKSFTASFNDNGQLALKIAERQGLEHIVSYQRMSSNEYFEKISGCYLALEDIYYVGGSRFGSECASVKVPIIGTPYSSACNIAFPELIAGADDEERRIELIQKLYSDEDFYAQICESGFKRNYDHYNSQTCVEDLMKKCKKHNFI